MGRVAGGLFPDNTVPVATYKDQSLACQVTHFSFFVLLTRSLNKHTFPLTCTVWRKGERSLTVALACRFDWSVRATATRLTTHGARGSSWCDDVCPLDTRTSAALLPLGYGSAFSFFQTLHRAAESVNLRPQYTPVLTQHRGDGHK